MRARRAAAVAEERAADGDLADELLAIGERGAQPHVLQRRRVDVAADGQDLGGREHGVVEAAGDVGHGREQQVAERVAGQRFARRETIVEDLRQQVFFLRQRHDAVADVAWRQHAELLAQRAGGAAFVGHRDDRAEPGDRPRAVAAGVALQAAQQRGETGAAADGDDVQSV